MADRILTDAKVVHLVQGRVVQRGISLPFDEIRINQAWTPPRLFLGTVYTPLTPECLILSDEAFVAQVIDPVLSQLKAKGDLPRPHSPVEVNDPEYEKPSQAWRVPRPEDVRGGTHGDYMRMAHCIQGVKAAMRCGTSWPNLSASQKEALELIATKIGRIVVGDPNCHDHWDDIAGYANLARDRIAHKPKV